jgi:signal transduction histidine kinase
MINPLVRGLTILALASFSVFALVAILSLRNWESSAAAEIQAEINSLQATSNLFQGIGALDPIARRAEAGQGYYLAVDMDGQKIVGNILDVNARPAPEITEVRRWRVNTPAGRRTIYGRWVRIDGSIDILVGRSPGQLVEFIVLVGSVFAASTLLAGVIAWRYTRRREQRDEQRLAAFAAAFEALSRGESVETRPDTKGDDPLSRLARLFNSQLSRIEDFHLTLRFFNRFIQHDVIKSLRRGRHELESISQPSNEVLRALDLVVDNEERCNGIRRLAEWESRQHRTLEPVDLRPIVENEVVHLEFEADGRGVTIQSELADVQGLGVSGALTVLIANLLRNAVLYTPDGGTVQVELAPLPDGRGQLRILDQGPGRSGFPQNFDFQRGPMEARRGDVRQGSDGLGIGLILAFRIARFVGAELFLEDRPGVPGLETRLVFASRQAPSPGRARKDIMMESRA